jgi:ubiquinone/menaquinone biosynthesis C-methylase UbiE
MPDHPLDFAATVERFTGFAALYDEVRPQPPTVLLDILAQLAQTERPQLVVDLGCGTGLSTRVWTQRAARVVGIEPSADMRRQAEQQATAGNVTYQEGYSHRTGLPDACADIVTCSQSLHWMEPTTTFREVARILRPGGAFAAYDCDWPPTLPHWEADAAYRNLMHRSKAVGEARGLYEGLHRWSKALHLERMTASGCFRFTKEIVLHHVELGNADRLIGLALSQGSLQTLLKQGVGEAEIGLDHLRAVATRTLGDTAKPWYFGYRARIGIV